MGLRVRRAALPLDTMDGLKRGLGFRLSLGSPSTTAAAVILSVIVACQMIAAEKLLAAESDIRQVKSWV
jgi:hypothetical protein